MLGFMIPLISSIQPIRRGLSTDLNEALDSTRSKTKGTLIQIIDNKALVVAPYLINGTIGVICSISVYYLLPLALL